MKEIRTTASDEGHREIEVSYRGNNDAVCIRCNNGDLPGALKVDWSGTLQELFSELALAEAARDLFTHEAVVSLVERFHERKKT